VHRKILVGCPVMDSYEACMEDWLSAVKSFDYPVEILLTDTSKGRSFCNRWQDIVDMRFIGVGEETPFRRIALGMEFIREYALTYKFDYFLCVEIDVRPPPETASLLRRMMVAADYDYVAHTYPTRGSYGLGVMIGFGCTMFSREFMKRMRFDGNSQYVYPDTWLWEFVVSRGDFKVGKIHGFLDISHVNCRVENETTPYFVGS
jgi:hypothetical protein